MSDAPAYARPAATVILCSRGRRHATRRLEVLLCRRTSEARFMPGVWVFPGGAVEPGDALDGELDTELAHIACARRELAEEAGIELTAEAEIVAWSRWITPVEVPVRFDTRFYLAEAPAHAKPQVDGSEIVDAAWWSPPEALAAHERGELALVFPTVRTLEALAPHATAEAAFEAARGARIEPILPEVVGAGTDARIVLPGDRVHEIRPDEIER